MDDCVPWSMALDRSWQSELKLRSDVRKMHCGKEDDEASAHCTRLDYLGTLPTYPLVGIGQRPSKVPQPLFAVPKLI